MKQSPLLRRFLMSKMRVDGNNYDFSHSESCLRTDSSWHIGLREYSIELTAILDQLLSVISDENCLKAKIQSLGVSYHIFSVEYDSLVVCVFLLDNFSKVD